MASDKVVIDPKRKRIAEIEEVNKEGNLGDLNFELQTNELKNLKMAGSRVQARQGL